jgi:DNA-binding GntR family transcriptional regulator
MTFDAIQPGHAVRYARMAIVGAPGDVARELGLAIGSDVIFMRLVVLDGSEPVACIEKYLPYVKGFPTIESVTHRADYPEFVDRKLWRILLRCELRIGAGRLDSDQARLLSCPESEPVTLVRRIIKSDEGKAVGYSLAWLREGYGELRAESGYAASRPISPEA